MSPHAKAFLGELISEAIAICIVMTFGLSVTYTGIPHLALTAGIQNLFDKNPPFTAHNVDEVVGAGWDPRVADPRGRAYTLLAKYTF